MINKTPILTNESYLVNGTNLDFDLINKKSKFNNIQIDYNDDIVMENLNINEFTYGIGNDVFDNNIKYNNHNLNLTTKKKTNMKIEYNFDNNSNTLANNININADHDLHLTVIYRSNTNDYNLLNSMMKINVKDNITVTADVVNLLNNKSNQLVAIEAMLNNESKMTFNVIDIGAKNSISNIYINALGKKAVGKINTIYMGENKELKDINYITHLRGESSVIDIDVEGTLDNESKKSFKGTIDFKKGAKKSKGTESEKCIMLSEKAISKALPILLCTEENVEGSHSAASGKIDEELIYYVMSRGIDKNNAVKMIVKAKFHKIIEKIKDEILKEEIIKAVERKLS